MLRLAIMSAGPSTSACTRGPAAIASMLVSPRASSICASIPMRPDRQTVRRLELGQQQIQRVHVRRRRSPSAARSGRGARLRAATTSMTSACVHGVVQSLTRTPRSWSRPAAARPARPPPARAPRPWPRARRRPRGRGTPRRRAGALAFSIIFALLPGTDRHVRRGRYRFSTGITLYPLSHGGGQQGLRGPTRGDGGARPRRRIHRPRARRGDQHQHRAASSRGCSAWSSNC